ncbi:MAG: transcription antiterminator [Erysipelotrichia bacterium]|nr:transcription antiterminator [Erysipelotrichia bacterium]
MKDRKIKLLRCLLNKNDWQTSIYLSQTAGCSSRTIKKYIAEILDEYPDLIITSRNGYLINNRNKTLENIRVMQNQMPDFEKERQKYILKQLLLAPSEVQNIDKIAGDLCVSSLTILNDVAKVKQKISSYDLTIKTRNYNLVFCGSEAQKKKLLSTLIYNDSKENFYSYEILQDYFPNINIKLIKTILVDTLNKNNYFIDDFSLQNLLIHIVILIQRKDKCVVDNDRKVLFTNAHIQRIVSEISEKISDHVQVRFTESERYDLCLLIMTRIIKDNQYEFSNDSLNEVVGAKVLSLVDIIKENVKKDFNIDLSNKDFIIRFSLHLKNLITRCENHIVLRNPDMLTIKDNYPFIYDLSVYITNIFTKYTGYILTEDEIAYIALHIGFLIEENKAINSKVKAIVICPKRLYYSNVLTDKILDVFKNSLVITAVTNHVEDINHYEKYDLLISTIDIITDFKHVARISDYVNHSDIAKISSQIDEIFKMKTRNSIESKLNTLFNKDFFYLNHNFKDEKSAIKTMSDNLYQKGYVEQDFKNKLLEREKISSSSFMNIAIPHPLEMCAISSVISVALNESPILWNDKHVNIVFMLAINIEDKQVFKDLFDFITEIISDEEKISVVLKSRNYEEFISNLVSFC